jgi:hypothetical protein
VLRTQETLVSPQMREWAKGAIRRIGKRVAPVETRREKRLVVVHLDGVPKFLLDQAIADGKMPFFSSAVRSGVFHYDSAFWGSPASTPCFQAGVLYGLRHPNLPAYHWYDRELGRVVKMNRPKDTLAIEQRLRPVQGGSLLEDGGTSYLSLFQADATNKLCMTALADARVLVKALIPQLRGIRGPRRRGVMAFMRDVVLDTVSTAGDALKWSWNLKDLRHEKEYVLNRFFLIQLAWELAHARTLIDMVRGVPAVYLVFGNFDEVAHRRGPTSRQATSELAQVDRALEELYAVSQTLEQPYDLVFVTDHGHVDSAPIEKRMGRKLEVALLEGEAPLLDPAIETVLLDGRPSLEPQPREPEKAEVIEAGNFAHVYLTRGKEPLEARELLAYHRDVLARAAANKDIGIVAMRRGPGAVAMIQGRAYGPDELDHSPLAAAFSKRAVADLLRELPHMKTAGDLVLYGEATHQAGTVGFAWEFGSHGGLTTVETDSVVCWPSSAPVNLGGMTHSTQLYERLSSVYRQ